MRYPKPDSTYLRGAIGFAGLGITVPGLGMRELLCHVH